MKSAGHRGSLTASGSDTCSVTMPGFASMWALGTLEAHAKGFVLRPHKGMRLCEKSSAGEGGSAVCWCLCSLFAHCCLYFFNGLSLSVTWCLTNICKGKQRRYKSKVMYYCFCESRVNNHLKLGDLVASCDTNPNLSEVSKPVWRIGYKRATKCFLYDTSNN